MESRKCIVMSYLHDDLRLEIYCYLIKLVHMLGFFKYFPVFRKIIIFQSIGVLSEIDIT